MQRKAPITSFICCILYVQLQSGKGAVGWKAPPKPARETVVRQPTQMQSDAAKRLSQGLSVASVNHSARQRYIAQNHLNLPNALASTGYSVVLDPHEYQQLQSSPNMGQNAYGAGAGGGAGAGASATSGSLGASSTALLGGPYVPVYGGIYPAFNSDAKAETLWPSTKANRFVRAPLYKVSLHYFLTPHCIKFFLTPHC